MATTDPPHVESDTPSRARKVKRIALGSSQRRLSYERRLRLWLLGFCAVPVILAGLLAWTFAHTAWAVAVVMSIAALLAWVAALALLDRIVRPLQTLANIIVALREDDFTLRARGARRGDALGDLALEMNLLAGRLQRQRSKARDAVTLAERVITAMPSPVMAFSSSGRLQLCNRAAAQLLQVPIAQATQRTAADLQLEALLEVEDGGVFTPHVRQREPSTASAAPVVRWSVRRTSFRLDGVPHTLVICSDVDAALHEEERVAWQRLIRVLGHEINNSLAPISSIAASLRSRLPASQNALEADLHRGLGVIEDRARALHRFLLAYQQLSRLPSPNLKRTELGPLLERVAQLEIRIPVQVHTGPPVTLLADADQLQQMFINLLRNAVEAAMDSETHAAPQVEFSWETTPSEVVIRLRDNGPGIANPRNLFVPFYTTKSHGSGIGLVLVRQIVTAHRGKVSISSREDTRGCDVLVQLPIM